MEKRIKLNNNVGEYKIPIKMNVPKDAKDIFILCHGFGSNKDNLANDIISEELLKNNIGVVAFDFPIHGESKAPIKALTVKNCILDIDIIFKYIKNNFKNCDISLFASSFGAYISINSLLTDELNFKYVILQSPAVNMQEVLLNSLLKEKFEDYKKNGIAKAARNGKLKISYDFYEDLKRHNLLQRLISLKQKMIIFHGTADDTALINDTRNFVNLNKEFCRLIEIPQANHVLEKQTIKDIIDFIIAYSKKNKSEEKTLEM